MDCLDFLHRLRPSSKLLNISLFYMDVLRPRFSANQIVEFIKVWHFKNELWNEIDFLYADKHERFAWV